METAVTNIETACFIETPHCHEFMAFYVTGVSRL